jgi:hypothetical protein
MSLWALNQWWLLLPVAILLAMATVIDVGNWILDQD